MKKFISNNKLIGSLKWGFFLGVLAIFIISPLCSDAVDEIPTDSLYANDLCIEKDTVIKDPATGQKIPFSELKSGNPKLSSSLNHLLSGYKFGGEPQMKGLARERSVELNKDLIQVVIEVTSDCHQPLAEEILENLKLKIMEVGGEFELDFHNLLQVLLPVHALEEVANWPEIKFIREPFRPHSIKDGHQSKMDVIKVFSSIQADEGHEAEIPIEYFQKNSFGDPTYQQRGPIEVQALKNFSDNKICLKKKIEKFSPEPSSTVQYDLSSQSVTSEGVSLIGADNWQDDGYTGEGIKIAIIDLGFKNYSSLLGIDLPDSVTTKFYGSGDDIYGTVHGTACAEIIHDMAPGAQFFLTQPQTDVELGNAVNWCISQGVLIISHSIIYSIDSGPLDGTGPINDIVNQAVNHGITWVNAAGNNATAHWGGDFYDPDSDGFLNFSWIENINGFETSDQAVSIGMIWDDPWGSSSNDYDLYVYDLANPSNSVASSVKPQDGDDDPSEYINFTPQSGVSYGFSIKKYSGISKNIQVNFLHQNPLEYQVAATSILIPADNPNVITVGAVAWNTPSEIEDFSSQGPTTDGRIKPEIAAPDGVSTSNLTYGSYHQTGGFSGTSASCPHVAGACALLKQAFPAWSPSQIKNYLEQNATDSDIIGKDNVYGSGLINLPASSSFENLLYFPHIASNSTWETEICVINTSSEQSLSGDLIAYNNSGQEVSSTPVILSSNGRREIIIGDELPNPSGIGYIIFESDSENVCGYTKFYIEGKYRVAVPAVSDINTGDIYLSHIASNTSWWTGVSLLNTTSSSKELTVEFDNGTTKPITIAAKEHQAFTINSLFGGVLQPNINSAVIKNGSGIVGLELFGSSDSSGDNYLSGILLKDNTTTHIYYPHIASNSTWWTGIVAYNPSITSCNLNITPFRDDGTSLTPQTISLPGHGKYIGTAKGLNFPDETAWFRIIATGPITGFELFGTTDGNQLGGYTGVGISGTHGVFAKTEKDGWTGIAFVNIENAPATVTMTAYDNSGNVIATEFLNINAYEKVVDVAPNLFSQDISNATHISYSSDRNFVGFQLNGSSDDMMLDALPGM
ncbi:MAG: hypothetical protein SRB2_00468 [Desulfobacteraceae bacterium Eth-SRB2]|nr:MAG: hypothetical protein SRB2_00468 [Desulfobacteraceae bacterium Eth-SRB2]